MNRELKATQSTQMNWSPTQLRIWDAQWDNNTATWTNAFTGKLWDIIIDKKEWTLGEYQDYYDKAKKRFWIS